MTTEIDTTTNAITTTLIQSLIKAQGAFIPLKKDASNPFFKSNYATLAAVNDAVDTALGKNGLTIIQLPQLKDDRMVLTTCLLHESGESISFDYLLSPAKDDPQGMGSAITYARRYAKMAILGLAPDDEDGNAASKRPPQKTKPQPPAKNNKDKKRAFAIATNDLKWDKDQMAEYFRSHCLFIDTKTGEMKFRQVESRKDFKPDNWSLLCDHLKTLKPKAQEHADAEWNKDLSEIENTSPTRTIKYVIQELRDMTEYTLDIENDIIEKYVKLRFDIKDLSEATEEHSKSMEHTLKQAKKDLQTFIDEIGRTLSEEHEISFISALAKLAEITDQEAAEYLEVIYFYDMKQIYPELEKDIKNNIDRIVKEVKIDNLLLSVTETAAWRREVGPETVSKMITTLSQKDAQFRERFLSLMNVNKVKEMKKNQVEQWESIVTVIEKERETHEQQTHDKGSADSDLL